MSAVVGNWTEFEGSIGAVERTLNLAHEVQPEDQPGETQTPPPGWPQHGAITFREVTASHRYACLLAPSRLLTISSASAIGIRQVSLDIEAGMKVGICGRTGR